MCLYVCCTNTTHSFKKPSESSFSAERNYTTVTLGPKMTIISRLTEIKWYLRRYHFSNLDYLFPSAPQKVFDVQRWSLGAPEHLTATLRSIFCHHSIRLSLITNTSIPTKTEKPTAFPKQRARFAFRSRETIDRKNGRNVDRYVAFGVTKIISWHPQKFPKVPRVGFTMLTATYYSNSTTQTNTCSFKFPQNSTIDNQV